MAVRIIDLLNPRRDRVTNGSFEEGAFDPPRLDLFRRGKQLRGWEIVDGKGDQLGPNVQAVAWVQSGSEGKAAAGQRFLNLAGYGQGPPRDAATGGPWPGLYAGVTQTIDTIPGTKHRLSFAVGTLWTQPDYGPAAVRVFVTEQVTPEFIPDVLGRAVPGGVPVYNVDDQIFFNTTVPDAGADPNVWVRYALEFIPTTSATQVTIYGVDASARAGKYIGLDDVSVRVVEGGLNLLLLLPLSLFRRS